VLPQALCAAAAAAAVARQRQQRRQRQQGGVQLETPPPPLFNAADFSGAVLTQGSAALGFCGSWLKPEPAAQQGSKQIDETSTLG